VGAPWKQYINGDNDDECVGNGGLSLRKKTKMLEQLKLGGYTKQTGELFPEDIFFSNNKSVYTNGEYKNNKINIKKPSVEIAKRFSVEGLFYATPVGIHKNWLKYTYTNSFGEQICNFIKDDEMKKLSETIYPLYDLIEFETKKYQSGL
jgi:hypothetical protein